MTFIFLFMLVYASYVHHVNFPVGWWIIAWIVALFGEPFDVRIRYKKDE